jgi:hypothetical protein
VLLFAGLSLGRADGHDDATTTITAQVSSADHETAEGYFSLGPDTTVVAKPGSDLFRFLSRQKGRRVKITVSVVDDRQLSRLNR